MWNTRFAMTLLAVLALTACGSMGGHAVRPLYKLEYQPASTTALAVSADSRRLATGGWSGRLAIWSLSDGSILLGFKAHDAEIVGIEFLRDGTILSGGREGSIKLWAPDGRLLWVRDLSGRLSAIGVHQPSGRFATGGMDGEIILWDLNRAEPVNRWQAHDSGTRALAWSGDAGLLASSDSSRTVKLWNTARGELLWESRVRSDSRDLVFSADGRWLYGGGWFDLFRWKVATGELQVIDTDHHGVINNLALIRSSGALASVSRQTDSTVLVIDPASGRTLKYFGSHGLCGERVAVSPDERYLISNSDDYSISVWELGPPPQ